MQKKCSEELPQASKRGFLKEMLGLGAAATVIPIVPVHAMGAQPPRRPGADGKRYAMMEMHRVPSLYGQLFHGKSAAHRPVQNYRPAIRG